MKIENKLKKKSSLMLSRNVIRNVRALLAEQHKTKRDLAEEMGAPMSTVYGILDDPKRIRVDHVEIFAAALGVPAAELFATPRGAK